MHTKPSAEIGANIRAELARRGLSQTEFASRMGISQSQLSKRLAGTIPIDVNELANVALALDVDIARLLDGAIPAKTAA